MIKQKLISRRQICGISLDEISQLLGMTQSQYSRRESGIVKISKKEWDKLAKELNTTLDEIYEPEDGIYIINNENANGNYSGSQNHFQSAPDFMFDNLKQFFNDYESDKITLYKYLQKFLKISILMSCITLLCSIMLLICIVALLKR